MNVSKKKELSLPQTPSLMVKSATAAQRAVTACVKFTKHWLQATLRVHAQCRTARPTACARSAGASKGLYTCHSLVVVAVRQNPCLIIEAL